MSPPPTRNLPLPASQNLPSPADRASRLPYLRQGYNSSSSQTLAPPLSPPSGVTPDPRASSRTSETPSEFAIFQEYSATNPSPQSTVTTRGPEQQNGKPTGQAPPKNEPLARSSSTSAEPEDEQGIRTPPFKSLHPDQTMGNVPCQVSRKLPNSSPNTNMNKDSRPPSARTQPLQVPPQPRQPPQPTRKSSTSIAPVQGKARILLLCLRQLILGIMGRFIKGWCFSAWP